MTSIDSEDVYSDSSNYSLSSTAGATMEGRFRKSKLRKRAIEKIAESTKWLGETVEKDCERIRALCGFIVSAAFIGIAVTTPSAGPTILTDTGGNTTSTSCIIPDALLTADMRSLYFDCGFYFGGLAFLLGFLGITVASVTSDLNLSVNHDTPRRLLRTWRWITACIEPTEEEHWTVYRGMTERTWRRAALVFRTARLGHLATLGALVSLSATFILLCWSRVETCGIIIAFTVTLGVLTIIVVVQLSVKRAIACGAYCKPMIVWLDEDDAWTDKYCPAFGPAPGGLGFEGTLSALWQRANANLPFDPAEAGQQPEESRRGRE